MREWNSLQVLDRVDIGSTDPSDAADMMMSWRSSGGRLNMGGGEGGVCII